MKEVELTIESTKFRQLLEAVGKIIPSKTVLAILQNVFIRVKDGKIQAIGSNQDCWLSAKADLISCSEKEHEIVFCLYSKQILQLLKELPTQPITIIVKENLEATIKWSNGKSNFMVYEAIEYPMPAKSKDDALHAVISTDKIMTAFTHVKQAVASDDLRPVMNCVAMDFMADKAVFVASDGHQLVRLTYEGYNEDESVSSPFLYAMDVRTIAAVESMIAFESAHSRNEEEPKNIAFDWTTTNTHISYGEGEVWSRNIEGRYPNYNSVIPKIETMNECIFNRAEMIAAIRRVLVFSATDGTKRIILHVENGNITLNAENMDYSTSATETVACECGTPLKIALNGRILYSIIQTIGGDSVKLLFNAATTAVIFCAVESDKDLLALQMPIKLD